MEANKDIFLEQKGIKTRHPFSNELLEDLYRDQKADGDTEGMKRTMARYTILKQAHDLRYNN